MEGAAQQGGTCTMMQQISQRDYSVLPVKTKSLWVRHHHDVMWKGGDHPPQGLDTGGRLKIEG